jgi:hypothetical protein
MEKKDLERMNREGLELEGIRRIELASHQNALLISCSSETCQRDTMSHCVDVQRFAFQRVSSIPIENLANFLDALLLSVQPPPPRPIAFFGSQDIALKHGTTFIEPLRGGTAR